MVFAQGTEPAEGAGARRRQSNGEQARQERVRLLRQETWEITAARTDALASFLRRAPGARFDIIVHDTRWIEACGARIGALFARHSHAMKIYRTSGSARAAMDPLLIVDDVHFVHRFHVDHTAGKLSIGSPERAKALVERFNEIWESGEPGVTGTVLGL